MPRFATLTSREREVLKMLAEGNSVKEIACDLNLSVKTVEAHKFNLMRKLDIHDKAQLVLNRSNAHTGISIDAVERVLPTRIAYQVVNDYRTAISSLNSGTPFMVNKPDSPIAKGVVKLARGLIEPHADQTAAPARVGKFAGALSALR